MESAEKLRNIHTKTTSGITTEKISEVLRKQFAHNTKDFQEAKVSQIKQLQKQKESVEQDRKNYRRDALKVGYNREEIEETTKDMDEDIRVIEGQISELSESSDMEQYLEKLPTMLLKTVELSGNAIQKRNTVGMREDIKKLLEITTVELTITNKKELKVKLFEVLDSLISDVDSVLEAPPGVEPGYGALQAPA